MKVLAVAYCFGGAFGQTLIGVYKRALRVAHALVDRGHAVDFYCAGRENYADDMTRSAEQRMRFIDWRWLTPRGEGARHNRLATLRALRESAPDVVLIGEAPLSGPLLEITLAAVELELPVACLDNAYGPDAVREFCRRHGPMYDGLVLTGPSAFQAREAPAHLLQVPPYIDAAPDAARALLAELRVGDGPLLVVLAYDANVEALGAALFARLERDDLRAVFLTHAPDACAERLRARLPEALRARTRVSAPLPDALHFGLLSEARLVVGKCAFMQVSECLSLGTPIIGFWFRGDFHLDYIPAACRPFTHLTDDARADDETVARARGLLELRRADMLAVHDGTLEAAPRTAAFLERLRRRAVAGAECAALGLGRAALLGALRAAHPRGTLELLAARASALREYDGQRLTTVVGHYRVDGEPHVRRLWLRRFEHAAGLRDELRRAAEPRDERRVLHVDEPALAFIEEDRGEGLLPEAG